MTSKKRGAKPKLTPELILKLSEVLRAGNYVETACDYVGISKASYYSWIAEAQKPGAKKIYLELLDAVGQARAVAEIRNVAKIQTAAEDSWQAASWWLERSHPGKWSKQQRLELTGAGGSAIDVSLDAKQTLIEMIKARQAQESHEV